MGQHRWWQKQGLGWKHLFRNISEAIIYKLVNFSPGRSSVIAMSPVARDI